MGDFSALDIIVFVLLVWVFPLVVYYILIKQDDDEPNRR